MKKIKSFLIAIFLLAGFNLCYGQNQSVIDSMINVLKKAKEDTNKVKTLTSLSNQFFSTGNFDVAKKYYDTVLALSEKTNFKDGEFMAYSGFGGIDREQGNYDDALINFNAALKIAEELGSKSYISSVLSNMGLVYWRKGNYPKALELYFRGLKIDEELNKPVKIAIDYTNIGNIYLAGGDYQEALKFFLLSVNIFQKLNDNHRLATVYNNIANIYFNQNNYDEGLKNLLAALNNFEKAGDKQGLAMTYNNLGSIYGRQRNYTKSLESHFACLKIAEENGMKPMAATSLYNIGDIYFEQRKFNDAGKYINNGLAIAKEIGKNDLIMNAYAEKSKLDSAMGNYKEALENYKLSTVYYDSLFNENSSKQIAEMQTKYESEKKDNEIKLLNKDKEVKEAKLKRQKLLINSFILGAILLIALSFFIFNNFRTRNKLRLQNIRNRIASDLHDDIGSTLNSISVYSEVAKQKSPTVVHELEQIGDASRKIIDAMSDIVWTINPKNDSFENIILRMRSFSYNLLKAKNIEHSFRADEGLDNMKLSMEERRNFFLIFKEAVNNLVKYAEATRVSIALTHENNLIKLSVRDNGKGFSVKQFSTGNGLLNMKSRAEEMNATIKIESEPGSGTHVELILKA